MHTGTGSAAAPESKGMRWGGYILTAIPAVMLTFSAVMKLVGGPQLEEGMKLMGWPMHLAVPLAILELSCVIVYLIPRTSVLGAILIAAYLGGATATHVRIGDAFWVQPLLGAMAWGGLWLRDARLRELIPLRKS